MKKPSALRSRGARALMRHYLKLVRRGESAAPPPARGYFNVGDMPRRGDNLEDWSVMIDARPWRYANTPMAANENASARRGFFFTQERTVAELADELDRQENLEETDDDDSDAG